MRQKLSILMKTIATLKSKAKSNDYVDDFSTLWIFYLYEGVVSTVSIMYKKHWRALHLLHKGSDESIASVTYEKRQERCICCLWEASRALHPLYPIKNCISNDQWVAIKDEYLIDENGNKQCHWWWLKKHHNDDLNLIVKIKIEVTCKTRVCSDKVNQWIVNTKRLPQQKPIRSGVMRPWQSKADCHVG